MGLRRRLLFRSVLGSILDFEFSKAYLRGPDSPSVAAFPDIKLGTVPSHADSTAILGHKFWYNNDPAWWLTS